MELTQGNKLYRFDWSGPTTGLLTVERWPVDITNGIVEGTVPIDAQTFKLYDIERVASGGMKCKADVRGSDPVVTMEPSSVVSITVSGTTLGIGDFAETISFTLEGKLAALVEELWKDHPA